MNEIGLLRTKDVAAILGVHRHQIERLVREKKIPTVTLPGMTQARFAFEDIQAFITAHKSWPDSGPIEPTSIVRVRSEKAEKRQLRRVRTKPGQTSGKPRPHGWRKVFGG